MEKLNKYVRRVLYFIWSCLLIFAVIWYIEPVWLQGISSQGKIVEGTEHKLKGDELLRQSDFEGAYSSYSRALEIESSLQSAAIGKAIAAERLNHNQEALAIYDKLLSEGAEKPYEIYYNLATIYEKNRDREKTIAALEKVIDTSPAPYDATVRLARLYFTSSQWKKALYYYSLAFETKPDMKNDYLNTLRSARIIYQLDEDLMNDIDKLIETGYTEAAAALYYESPYMESLKSDPTLARIYNDAGYCYASLGDVAAGLPFFQQAAKIQPDNEEYRQNLERAQQELKE
ncbi:MAG: tetratricopeptide repeat protein [Candidatus Cloacimonetes bacterium]|nr:tetratricopeptide repeat protein [Candidatus Cloacimonadota bacterium]